MGSPGSLQPVPYRHLRAGRQRTGRRADLRRCRRDGPRRRCADVHARREPAGWRPGRAQPSDRRFRLQADESHGGGRRHRPVHGRGQRRGIGSAPARSGRVVSVRTDRVAHPRRPASTSGDRADCHDGRDGAATGADHRGRHRAVRRSRRRQDHRCHSRTDCGTRLVVRTRLPLGCGHGIVPERDGR